MAVGRMSSFYGEPLYQAAVDTAVTMEPGTDKVKRFRWHPKLAGSLLAPYESYKDARLRESNGHFTAIGTSAEREGCRSMVIPAFRSRRRCNSLPFSAIFSFKIKCDRLSSSTVRPHAPPEDDYNTVALPQLEQKKNKPTRSRSPLRESGDVRIVPASVRYVRILRLGGSLGPVALYNQLGDYGSLGSF